MTIDEGPDQEAHFYIEGPDEDGCVWICSADIPGQRCHNIGPADKVVEVLSQWLASLDDADRLKLTHDE
jgi:hypothetical protein